MGLERWDIIKLNYKSCNTLEGMKNVLDLIKYSNCYEEPFWYSEIVRYNDDEGNPITIDTPHELCTLAKAEVIDSWNYRDRDFPKVWITCHSSIYNLRNKTLYLVNQENDLGYDFSLC